MDRRKIVVVLKGYPRLSETFIAQELLGLERAGFDLSLISMRFPTDTKRHPIHDEIRAPVHYLPEYLHHAPLRVLRALAQAWRRPGFKPPGVPSPAISSATFRAIACAVSARRRFWRRNGRPAAPGCMPISFTRPPPSPAMPAC